MRIGINAQKALEPETGVGNYAFNLVKALARQPEASEWLRLFFFTSPDGLSDVLGPLTIEAGKRRRSGRVSRILWEQLGLPHRAAGRVDILHYIDHALPVFYRPCPVVITVHDLAFFRHPEMYDDRRRRYKQWVGKRSIPQAAHIIAISESTRSDLEDMFPETKERISVIHYGKSPDFHPAAGPENRILEKYDLFRPYFLFVGALQPRKNLKGLIEAYAKVVATGDLPHELVLAGGEGWLMEDLTVYSGRFRVADRVRLLGSVSHTDMPDLYRGATALVYPSWFEGFGLPPLEAMASGTPVIAGRNTSLPEVVGDAGLLLPPDDIDALAEAMRRLATDAVRHDTLRRKGLVQAERFSWDECAAKTLAVYRRVHEEAAGRR